MKEIKCICGHVNPNGTILCEACGIALTEEAKIEKLHDMRYEGSARRSQTYDKTAVDKIWTFFSFCKSGGVADCNHIDCICTWDGFTSRNVYTSNCTS